MQILELQNISASYNNEAVLKNASLTVNEGDYIGIIGPNGGGKTTLLKIILGLKKPDKGSIKIREGINIGYLPQQTEIDKMFPITVKEVIFSGLMKSISHKKSSSHIFSNSLYKSRYKELTEKMKIDNIGNKAVGEISGGQLQKTLLCRSLISNPDILLLDEPNTYIDKGSEFELFEFLRDDANVKAILLVSHDIGTISQYVKTYACVNKELYYHNSQFITEEILDQYHCPIQLIAHGNIPHTILKHH